MWVRVSARLQYSYAKAKAGREAGWLEQSAQVCAKDLAGKLSQVFNHICVVTPSHIVRL